MFGYPKTRLAGLPVSSFVMNQGSVTNMPAMNAFPGPIDSRSRTGISSSSMGGGVPVPRKQFARRIYLRMGFSAARQACGYIVGRLNEIDVFRVPWSSWPTVGLTHSMRLATQTASSKFVTNALGGINASGVYEFNVPAYSIMADIDQVSWVADPFYGMTNGADTSTWAWTLAVHSQDTW